MSTADGSADLGKQRGWAASWWHLRSNLALRWSPALLVLGAVAAGSNAAYLDPYWLDIAAAATIAEIFLAPVAAALAAWEASRLRGHELLRASLRSPLGLLAGTVLPILGVAVVILLALSAWFAFRALSSLGLLGTLGMPGGTPWSLLLLAILVIATHAVVGYLVGSVLPRIYAVPLSIAGSFVWLTYPQAFEPMWLRNVNGHLGTSCCSLDQVLAPYAVAGPAVLATAVLLGALCVVALRGRRLAAAVLALLLVLGAATAARAMVKDYGPDPVVARTDGLSCVPVETTKLCAWREHLHQVPSARRVVEDAVARLGLAGVPPPERITEATPGRHEWGIWLGDGQPDAVRASLANSVLGPIPPPCVDSGRWRGELAVGPTQAWLALAVGISSEEVRGSTDEESWRTARDVRERSSSWQADWIREQLRLIRSCAPTGTPGEGGP